ncbi:MAG: nuclear transport factor 2 family protein [Nitrospira sp.]|nr:nuclear transport factor 2 family protein [Nitrospira sp.]MCB9711966.1 nuclear transport factor 2 family protein [Nitrospiraceae bacterium]MDR4489092.1 nuclear transport factor 2 family protein [Nitrospirales bacterium]MCA9465977.1 nuclear transport factor 2 family protein [Nitrospira sp.]MCA9476752.1 nuclear transport factor 2 family protein [Nitrospira sp.]
MSIKTQVQAVIDGILNGNILETFDAYYADDVVMSENQKDERVGKAANRQYEIQFLENVQAFHGGQVGRVIVDGNHAAVEWTFDMTLKGGNRVTMHQVAVQTWKDGKIIREDFYHG